MSSVNMPVERSRGFATLWEVLRLLASLGVNYRRAPLSVLDALTLRDPPAFYKTLRSTPGVRGAVIVQTCNRVVFFIDADEGVGVSDKILWNWALHTKFKLHELRKLSEERTGSQVPEYLVSLASGLESMLVGESQILGQIKSSLIEARRLDASSPILSTIFEMSLAAGARIRNQTGIGRGTISLGSVALKVAQGTLGNLDRVKILLLGTGQIGMILMKALNARGIKDVTVAGRTLEATESFCRAFGGKPLDFKKAISQLGLFRLVVVATRATDYLLTRDVVPSRLKPDGDVRLMILDLSIPKNVSPDLGQLDGIVVKTIDDLRDITEQAVLARKALMKEAEPKVKEAVENITAQLRRLEVEPIVSDLYHRADKIRKEELEKALTELAPSQHQQQILERMSLSLVQKLLAQPVVNLREAAKKGDRTILAVAGQIFEGE
jgi:glutamyl-tRNA reductase